MVRAILAGQKTQTRRIVKNQQDMEFDPNDPSFGPYWNDYVCYADGEEAKVRCPYGNPGDRLWVRETHRYWFPEWTDPPAYPCKCRYKADNCLVELPVEWEEDCQFSTPEDIGLDIEPTKWRPSIFMPRWASRITLEITAVRVERIQSISGPDCWAEGIKYADWDPEHYGSTVECYRDLWKSIHGLESWEANPYVWVLELRRITPLNESTPA
ncbi:MAG: hypothetical protein ACO3QS_06935 [Burkholderiaceae bacterium]